MSSYDYEDSKLFSTMDEGMSAARVIAPVECPATICETVSVQAEVTIVPNVTVGEIQTFCVCDPVIGVCQGTPVSECTFMVNQKICVQVPLTFSAIAQATPAGIVCGEPKAGGCTS